MYRYSEQPVNARQTISGPRPPRSGSQSLERGLDILEMIEAESGDIGVRELARRLGLSPTIVQRLVSSLAVRGYIEKNLETSRYRLGHRSMILGASGERGVDYAATARRELDRLAHEHHLNGFVAVLRGGRAIYLLAVQAESPVAIRVSLGSEMPLHSTAAGKVLLASLVERGPQACGPRQARRHHAAYHHRPRRAHCLAGQGAAPGLCHGRRGEHSGRAVGRRADHRSRRQRRGRSQRGLSQISRKRTDPAGEHSPGDGGGAAHLARAGRRRAWHGVCNAFDFNRGALRREAMRVRILAAAAIAGLWGMGSAMAQPIVIGVSTPQTGVAAVASEWEMWGVNLAVEEINAAGGLLGGRKLELMVLDNKCNPSEAVNVANKLVEAKVVAIEGAHCSSAHLASMKIVADAKIPMITGIASNPQITALAGPGRNEYSFRISPSDSAMMEALGIYLGNKKTFKTVAIVGEDTDFGRGGADAFKAVADKAGVTVVSTDFHPQNAPDFTSILTRLQQRRPDAIATFQVGGDSINFLRQAMQLGVKIPYTGRIELGGRNTPIIEAGGMEKSISAWTYNATIDAPTNKAFVEKIKAKYKSEPYLQTWGGYDAIRIIAQAITDCKCTDGEKIKDAIKKMTFTNVMGKTVTFDDHNSAGRFVVLQTVLDKKVGVADIVEVK
jgi:branched-chain amino acid transport system substrate-binding protein